MECVVINRTIGIARKILEQEILGLQSMMSVFDDDFANIIDILSKAEGKIITLGIGKSGVIAKKFSATLSSTGTPSIFLHPVEALHGDLGILAANDIAFFLSNSGESEELNKVLRHCMQYDVTTVCMSRNRHSQMVKDSVHNIVLPDVAEVSALPAPTTSTTMMLACCDAIAITLAEIKGFTPEDFRIFHPGGKIGISLLSLKDVMHTGDTMPLINDGNIINDAIIEIATKRFGCVGVVDGAGALIGMITDGDLRKHSGMDYRKFLVGDIMTKKPLTLDENTLISQALHIFNTKKITNAFVVDSSARPIGIVHIHDLIKMKH